MPLLATRYFGTVPFNEGDRYHFPLGLPAFETERSFVLIDMPGKRPLVFLQSTRSPQLCFLALPILVVNPDYDLRVSIEDLTSLGLEPGRQPLLGAEVLVLALLSLEESRPATANLLSPVVINLRDHLALQAIRSDLVYSHQHPLGGLGRSEAC